MNESEKVYLYRTLEEINFLCRLYTYLLYSQVRIVYYMDGYICMCE